MTCTPMTKQLDGQAITDCPGDPNIWYILSSIPPSKSTKPSQASYIPMVRMSLLNLASPMVGMAGTNEHT